MEEFENLNEGCIFVFKGKHYIIIKPKSINNIKYYFCCRIENGEVTKDYCVFKLDNDKFLMLKDGTEMKMILGKMDLLIKKDVLTTLSQNIND